MQTLMAQGSFVGLQYINIMTVGLTFGAQNNQPDACGYIRSRLPAWQLLNPTAVAWVSIFCFGGERLLFSLINYYSHSGYLDNDGRLHLLRCGLSFPGVPAPNCF